MPKNFSMWDISDGKGLAVAHEAASKRRLPKTFDRWRLARRDGWTKDLIQN